MRSLRDRGFLDVDPDEVAVKARRTLGNLSFAESVELLQLAMTEVIGGGLAIAAHQAIVILTFERDRRAAFDLDRFTIVEHEAEVMHDAAVGRVFVLVLL